MPPSGRDNNTYPAVLTAPCASFDNASLSSSRSRVNVLYCPLFSFPLPKTPAHQHCHPLGLLALHRAIMKGAASCAGQQDGTFIKLNEAYASYSIIKRLK